MWSLLPGADKIWYLLELLSSPLLLSQRTSGMGSPQTTARKMAFLPGEGEQARRVTVPVIESLVSVTPLPGHLDRPLPEGGLALSTGSGAPTLLSPGTQG